MPSTASRPSTDGACPSCSAPLALDATVCAACHSPVSRRDDVSGGRARALLDFIETGDGTPTPTPSRRVLEAAADPRSTRTNRWTLRFASHDLEGAFRAEYRLTTLRNAPLAAGLALALIVAFGLLDAILLPEVRRELWLIRYGIMAPFFALVLGACYVPALGDWVEKGLAASVLVAGGSIIAMILISPAPGRYFYYAGLILVVIYDYNLLRMRFAIMNALAWAVVGAYLALELVIGGTPWHILVNNMFFFVAAGVIGMVAAHRGEWLARQNFLQDKLVRRAREFGSYRLAGRIGQGGMGEVWRAEHRLLARPAAIKLIRAETLGTDATERRRVLHRFEREAQATALLRSPHTVEVYDFGVAEDGTFYYVMELLEGYDAHTFVRRFGAVPPGRAIRLLLHACDSLGEAHENGLTHRDIKPANLYVCRYGREIDFGKVLDFGIATWTGPSAGEVTEATMARFAGTPSSMAPEQIHGERPVDARTDLYGLGCVAYWLLTGGPAFRAANHLQVLARHLGAQPEPPSQVAAQRIPAELDDVVLWCLRKDPDDRPQSADELAARLRTLGGPPWSEAEAREWWAENPPATDAEDPNWDRTVVPSGSLRSTPPSPPP